MLCLQTSIYSRYFNGLQSMVSQQLMCAHSKKNGEFRIHVHAACLPTVAVQYKEHEDGEKVRTDAAQGVGGFVYSCFGGT